MGFPPNQRIEVLVCSFGGLRSGSSVVVLIETETPGFIDEEDINRDRQTDCCVDKEDDWRDGGVRTNCTDELFALLSSRPL